MKSDQESGTDNPVQAQAPDEPVLILRAFQGQPEAWELLVRLHQQPVFRLAYLMLGDADQAEDITQETFIRAYHALDRFDRQRPLRPWLLRIAANLAHNQRRSTGRFLSALQRWFQAEPSQPANVEEKSLDHLAGQALWRAVRCLDEKDQQVIYLRYFLELSTEEAAEAMQIPIGTVKSRLSRALSRLRKIIEVDFPELAEGIQK